MLGVVKRQNIIVLPLEIILKNLTDGQTWLKFGQSYGT